MRFQLKAKAVKKVWFNDRISLWEMEERYKDKTKKWKIFTDFDFQPGTEYMMDGFVNANQSKKYKDDKGYFATEYSFQTQNVKQMDAETELFGEDSQERYF